MSDVERGKALLQAAGLTGVTVQAAEETVTVSRAELEALRAGAQGETPGQKYVREQGQAQPAEQLPEGILSVDELERIDQGGGQRGGTHSERMKANNQYCASYEYHASKGAI
jgi:hypothetical protein